jgi:hypothetical protein
VIPAPESASRSAFLTICPVTGLAASPTSTGWSINFATTSSSSSKCAITTDAVDAQAAGSAAHVDAAHCSQEATNAHGQPMGVQPWRWRESNPRPRATNQVFSGRSWLVVFSAPALAPARCRQAQSQLLSLLSPETVLSR